VRALDPDPRGLIHDAPTRAPPTTGRHENPANDTPTPRPVLGGVLVSERRGPGGSVPPGTDQRSARLHHSQIISRKAAAPRTGKAPAREHRGLEHPFRLDLSQHEGGERMSVLTTVAHTLTGAVAHAPRWSTSHDRLARAAQRPGAGARRRQARRPFRQHAVTGRRSGLVICARTGRRMAPARLSGVADRG